MIAIVFHFVASEFSFTGFAAEALISRTLAVVEFKKLNQI